MVNDKMCICVNSEEILYRIGQDMALLELDNGHCRQMIHNGKTMKDYVFVDYLSIQKQSELQHWVRLCLDFNVVTKSSKKKVK